LLVEDREKAMWCLVPSVSELPRMCTFMVTALGPSLSACTKGSFSGVLSFFSFSVCFFLASSTTSEGTRKTSL